MRRHTIHAVLITASTLCVAVGFFAPVTAMTSSKSISRSFSSKAELKPGTVVSVTKDGSNAVEAANINNASKLIGVVVADEGSLIAVDPDSSKAQIASSGSAPTLVSTANGDIKKGDKIAVSPFTGIGMKFLVDGYVVGVAANDFDANGDAVTQQSVIDKNGDRKVVAVGYVAVTIAPRFDAGPDGEKEVSGLQNFVRTLTGHTVSTPRLIASLILVVVTVVGIGVLMYAAIYGSIISIGRNPLARDSILKALTQVFGMALLITTVGFGMIYLLLR